MTKFKKGDIVAVTFSDHVEDGSEPIEFVVYGRVAAKTRLSLVVDCWEYLDAKTPYDSNEKRYTILRRVVSRVVVLEPRPEGTKI